MTSRDELQAAWDNLVRVSNREEDTVMVWLVSGAIRGLSRELEDAEDEQLRAERFRDALAVGRLGYPKTRTTPGEEESRVERAEGAVEQARAELRFLLAVKERLREIKDARWSEMLRAWFRDRSHAVVCSRKRKAKGDA